LDVALAPKEEITVKTGILFLFDALAISTIR
jgi:hypothetical protein